MWHEEKERSRDRGADDSRDEVQETSESSQQTPSAVQSPDFGVVPGNSDRCSSVPVFVDPSAGSECYAICTALVNRVENVLALGRSTATTTVTFDLVHSCIDMFLQYMFPNTPIAHEPTLRAGASLFLQETARRGQRRYYIRIAIRIRRTPRLSPSSPLFARSSCPWYQTRCYLTRIYLPARSWNRPGQCSDCTKRVILINPTRLLWLSVYGTQGHRQNSTGRIGPAWHYHSEASLLALRLRLYDEEAVRRDSAVESRLLRASFWLLYLADKSAAALESRTPVLTEHLFDGDLTLLKNRDHDEPLLDEARNVVQNGLEGRISLGFHLKAQIWTAAAHVITEVKAHLHRQKHLGRISECDKDLAVAHISDLNLHFSTLIYELPPWLQRPDSIDNADPAVATYQATCLWALKSNIMTTYHCLKLVILQKCIESDMIEVLGLTRQPLSWAMRKMEIIQEFINELQIVPFLCYKVQGEAGVSIRNLVLAAVCV